MRGLVFILLVLLAIAVAASDRDPRAAIEDTTRAEVAPVRHAAAPITPDEKPPIAWHLNSRCVADPLKQGEYQV